MCVWPRYRFSWLCSTFLAQYALKNWQMTLKPKFIIDNYFTALRFDELDMPLPSKLKEA